MTRSAFPLPPAKVQADPDTNGIPPQAGAVAGGAAAAPARPVGSPRSVTRGESKPPQAGQQAAKVDWLNCTFPGPDRYTVAGFVALLSRMFRRPLQGVEGRGIFGFDKSCKLIASVGSRAFVIGCLAYGGESQRGRWMLQLTGAGCPAVRDWHKMARLLKALDARITRLDLAVDYLEGEYSVDDAVAMHSRGEFSSGGRPPSTSVAGDWLGGVKGRTLYVGNAANGKMLRVYEKGLQLGDARSEWVRFEVQLGNRDRVIPFEAMTRRDAFLAGCYPALEAMLGCAAEAIDTTRSEGAVSLAHLMFHLKRSYGKLIDTVGAELAADSHELIDSLRVIGAPRRLKPGAVSSGLTWAQLLAQLER